MAKTHRIHQGVDINEYINNDTVNVGDIIRYEPDNQEGILIYRVIKSVIEIGNQHGLYPVASNESAAAAPGGGRRRTHHKNRRTKRRHNKKRHTKRRR